MFLNRVREKRWAVIVGLVCMSASSVAANEINSSHQLEAMRVAEARKTQLEVDASSEAIQSLEAEIAQLNSELDSLTLYRTHLESLVQSQEQDLVSLERQHAEIADTKKNIVPLMYRMLSGLEELIEQDKPIRVDSRKERLVKLNSMMGLANVSEAEKFRRILEAYLIELDYNTKFATYMSDLTIDGQTRQAELLHLGKAVFIARSLDKQRFWIWNETQNNWDKLTSEYSEEINQAYAIANKQASPAIVTLPVSMVKEHSL